MQYPHWLMIAGAVLVVLGFIGFAFSQNRSDTPVDERAHDAEPKAKGKWTTLDASSHYGAAVSGNRESEASILKQIIARYRLSLEFERKGRLHALLEAVKAVLKR
jgi:hypothetical protein